MTELRPYQLDAVRDVHRHIAAGVRRMILVCPTGGGKTIVAAALANDFVAAGRPVLALAHRREIVQQTSDKLDAHGIEHGIIMAGHGHEPLPVQVASVQTLHVRAMRGSKLELPAADLVLVDECHHATAQSWRDIIAAYPDAVVLGLTATPCRGDGRGLGGIFEAMIECPQVPELIDRGFLVPTRVYAPAQPDLTGVRVAGRRLCRGAACRAHGRPSSSATSSRNGTGSAKAASTVVFATGVQHSVHIRDEFRKSGVACDHLDGSTPKDERDDILAKLACGAIDVVTNCMVLTEGWDMPDVGCCVLARPTKKMGLYRQMIGRVLRPAPGKTGRHRDRPFRRSLSPRLRGGSRRVDAVAGTPRQEPDA